MSNYEGNKPHVCPVCSRAFAWGADADSTDVDAQGQQWISCRENAHWKLLFHMHAAHPEVLLTCPRRGDPFAYGAGEERQDYWYERNHMRVCSYCGSLHPDDFMKAIDDGHEIGPTDKNYKAYVDLPNPDVGKMVWSGSSSGPAFRDGQPTLPDLTPEEIAAGRYSRANYSPAGPKLNGKFYYQHLSHEQMQRFVDKVNDKSMKIGYPNYFYRKPYFMVTVPAA